MSSVFPFKIIFQSPQEVTDFVSNLLTKGVTDQIIKENWLAIANLYFKVGDTAQAKTYLVELLALKPYDSEANKAIATIYRFERKYEKALEYYENCGYDGKNLHYLFTVKLNLMRVLTSVLDSLIIKAAEICLILAKKTRQDKQIKKYVKKALYFLKRNEKTLQKTDQRIIQLYVEAYTILVNHAEKQLETRGCLKYRVGKPIAPYIEWIEDSKNDLITIQEKYKHPELDIILMRALLKKREFKIVRKHILKSRYHFSESWEWNTFIKDTFWEIYVTHWSDKYKEILNTQELFYSSYDNLVRIALESRHVKSWGFISPPHCETSQEYMYYEKIKEKWNREYQSKIHRHDAFFQLILANLGLFQSEKANAFPKAQDCLHAAYTKLKDALRYRRNSFNDSPEKFNHFTYLMCQRISEVSERLFSLLYCFDYRWLNVKSDAQLMLRPQSEYEDDVMQRFVLPRHSHLLKVLCKEYDRNAISEYEELRWVVENAFQVDMIAHHSPYNLDSFLMVAAWYVENGQLRDWLRSLFSRLQEYSKAQKDLVQDQALSPLNKENSGSRERFSDESTPTLMDIENFLIILLIQRHYYCVTKFEKLNAKTLGQILDLAHQKSWSPNETHRKFWHTLLRRYGKDDPDHVPYNVVEMSREEFIQCLREIRGNIKPRDYVYTKEKDGRSILSLQRDLFGIMVHLFKDMHARHHKHRYIEGFIYADLYEKWDQIMHDNLNKSKTTRNRKLRFLILDDKISYPGYGQFNPDFDYEGADELSESFTSYFAEKSQIWDTSIDDEISELDQISYYGISILPDNLEISVPPPIPGNENEINGGPSRYSQNGLNIDNERESLRHINKGKQNIKDSYTLPLFSDKPSNGQYLFSPINHSLGQRSVGETVDIPDIVKDNSVSFSGDLVLSDDQIENEYLDEDQENEDQFFANGHSKENTRETHETEGPLSEDEDDQDNIIVEKPESQIQSKEVIENFPDKSIKSPNIDDSYKHQQNEADFQNGYLNGDSNDCSSDNSETESSLSHKTSSSETESSLSFNALSDSELSFLTIDQDQSLGDEWNTSVIEPSTDAIIKNHNEEFDQKVPSLEESFLESDIIDSEILEQDDDHEHEKNQELEHYDELISSNISNEASRNLNENVSKIKIVNGDTRESQDLESLSSNESIDLKLDGLPISNGEKEAQIA
ncbi:12555_t:CDS:10 [Ambispora leptoticha]|uniref:12555_t:CDS:1 n=1 Tax=Ambispora leptoticha TaxID=144679 RepID=A0A9N9C1P5_9GLOM|nr:12555_t:CDS:10 [Ambispora leptoticha]